MLVPNAWVSMRLRPKASEASATPNVNMPSQSNRNRSERRAVGSTRSAITITAAATGKLIRNNQRQPAISSTPPRMGPMMNASPNTAPISPSARPRFSGGKVSPITADATGKMPPAPRPWMARPMSTKAKVGANETTNEPAAKMATSMT